MDMTVFAQSVVRAADAGQLTLLPISKRDAFNGCMIRFRFSSLASEPITKGQIQIRVQRRKSLNGLLSGLVPIFAAREKAA